MTDELIPYDMGSATEVLREMCPDAFAEPPGLVTWLRREITADLDAARLISAGGFEPQRWDTEPPGQVNPEPVPYRGDLNVVVIPDEEDRMDRESVPYWVEVVAYDRMNNEPPEADCRDSDLPVMLVDDGRREVDHIIRHDPRNVVADCEAKLAILDLYEKQAARAGENAMEEDRTWILDPVVRLLGAGYKHRPGYREEWKP